MKILFLSQRFLFPFDDGGKIRTGNILKNLSKNNYITIISNFESQTDDKYLPQLKNICSKYIPVHWKKVKKNTIIFYMLLIKYMFSIYPVSVLNTYSKELKSALEKALCEDQYDLVICDFVQCALMFNGLKDINSILFQHNVESMILHRHYKEAKNPFAALFWMMQWKKMAIYEKLASKRFDTVISVSDKDKNSFKRLYGLKNVVDIPTGVDVEYFSPIPNLKEEKNALVFCGSMDWLPNEDAMIYFIKNILPIIKDKIQNITLTIVGKNPSQNIKKIAKQHQHIKVTGWVEDIRPYIQKGSIVIVPIRIGGGTRMKIYEAMAMGKPIVSTSIGAEGLPIKKDKNIFIEDAEEKFAEKIIELLINESERKRVGQNGMKYVRDNFTWSNVSNEFEKICRITKDGIHST